MSNKSTGTKFELELSKALADRGFWVHRLQDNQNGQPCDLIACRNGQAWLIDCKDCQGDFFQLSRIGREPAECYDPVSEHRKPGRAVRYSVQQQSYLHGTIPEVDCTRKDGGETAERFPLHGIRNEPGILG